MTPRWQQDEAKMVFGGHLEANLAPKSSQNREKERLRSLLGNHLEKGSQNDEKKSLPKMKNRAFLMEGCSKSHFQLTATT